MLAIYRKSAVIKRKGEKFVHLPTAIGYLIDPKTAEVYYGWINVLDPYEDAVEEPATLAEAGVVKPKRMLVRIPVARDPNTGIVVDFSDLPHHVRAACWKKLAKAGKVENAIK